MHIFLATPCFGGLVTHGYLHGVLQLLRQSGADGIQVTVETLAGDSLIPRARIISVSAVAAISPKPITALARGALMASTLPAARQSAAVGTTVMRSELPVSAATGVPVMLA